MTQLAVWPLERKRSMKQELFFRSICDDDRQAVVDLWSHCGLLEPEDDPAEAVRVALDSENTDILLAFQPDSTAPELAMVGTVQVGHDGRHGWIHHIAVDPKHQRRGVGLSLAREAESWLRDRRISRLSVLVKTTSAEIVLFFARLGYLIAPRAVMQKLI
jgi:ribosomal protein S18 acetylase RimI-like enzyme